MLQDGNIGVAILLLKLMKTAQQKEEEVKFLEKEIEKEMESLKDSL